MSIEDRVSRSEGAMNQNLNGIVNSGLLVITVYKPIIIRRMGVLAAAVEGLLEPMRLKIRRSTALEGTVTDVPGFELRGAVRARGEGLEQEIFLEANVGDTIFLSIAASAGGVSTGDVFFEYWELPFSGDRVANFIPAPTE